MSRACLRQLASIRLSVLLAALAFVISTGAAQDTSAQLLDGQWFKLSVNGKGLNVSFADNDVDKEKRKFTMYMLLISQVEEGSLTGGTYIPLFMYEQSPGVWVPTNFVVPDEGGGIGIGTGITLIGEDERYMTPALTRFLDNDAEGVFPDEGTFIVGWDGIWTADFKTKTDKQGDFKSASFKSLGGTITDGGDEENNLIGGGFTVKGKTVPVKKLPFDPNLLP